MPDSLWQDRHSFIGDIRKALFAALVGFLIYALGAVFQPQLKKAILILSSGAVAFVLSTGLFKTLSLKYRLVSRTLYHTSGAFGLKEDEVDLARVDDVSVRRTPLDALAGVGTVVIACPTDPTHARVLLDGVETPHAICDLIRGYVAEERGKTLRVDRV